MTNVSEVEQQGLRLTVWMALFMAALGIGFYFPTRSQAILLDGIFSLIGFFVSLVTIKVARLVYQPDDEEFQFGYGAFEPMLNLGKGFMIAGVCVFALIPAVEALFKGGRPLQSGPAIGYALVAAAGCFAMWASQRRRARKVNSPLLKVDVHQWLMDGAISSVVAVAFIVGAIMERGPLARYVAYLDPLLVVVLVAATAHVPIGIIRGSLREVLLGAPSPEVRQQLAGLVANVLKEEGFSEHRLRTIRSGRSHMLLLHVYLADDEEDRTVTEFDAVRERLHAAVPDAFSPFTIDVVFTRDRRWIT